MTRAAELFIYWSLPRAALAEASSALAAWQARLLAQADGPQALRYLRVDAEASHAESPARATLMETYAWPDGIDDGLLAAWRQRIVTEGDACTAPWRVGPRHIEVFERLP